MENSNQNQIENSEEIILINAIGDDSDDQDYDFDYDPNEMYYELNGRN